MLLLLSCQPSPEIPNKPDAPAPTISDHGVPEGHEFSSYTGRTHWTWDFTKDGGKNTCDFWWDAVGTPISKCPDCNWTFRVQMTVDEEKSSYDAACLGDLESADMAWSVGLIENFRSYNVPVLMIYDDGYYRDWLPAFVSTWTYPDLIWGGGWLSMPVINSEQEYAYTNYWYGTAVVK